MQKPGSYLNDDNVQIPENLSILSNPGANN